MIDKYYPQFFTQFIIGVVCYIIVFLILSELVPTMTYTEYKYHLFSLIGIDLAYLVYVARFQKNFFPFNTTSVEPTPPKDQMVISPTLLNINNNLDALRIECMSDKPEAPVVKSPKQSVTQSPKQSITQSPKQSITQSPKQSVTQSETQSPTRSISFTSEINDFRITHDPSLEDNETEDLIFSNSERVVSKSNGDQTTSLNVSDIVSK